MKEEASEVHEEASWFYPIHPGKVTGQDVSAFLLLNAALHHPSTNPYSRSCRFYQHERGDTDNGTRIISDLLLGISQIDSLLSNFDLLPCCCLMKILMSVLLTLK
ncbi:nudix hydrolase 13, mitochondrial-like isoform X1 [Gossypium australe]|uniref:Nudix hydrolase 13, mitochondrial-like isoform X1 n=1 Tax=Gossypium australe TaxID=47621 RepID=A0A5B6V0B9_9ROSI|nr:nudix hydrolase 13, mitochondrial-like isoform X1 [Gossypium australe]